MQKIRMVLFFFCLLEISFSQSLSEKTAGFLPKEELGVSAHLLQNPTHDGRNILVAVIDTGVDLNHPGLQKTSTGQRKIVDFYDATGSSVLPCPVQVLPVHGKIRGLSGYLLDVSHLSLKQPQIRLGLLSTQDFFPEGLVKRLEQNRQKQAQENRQRLEDQHFGEKNTLSEEEKALQLLPFQGDFLDVVVFETAQGWKVLIDTNQDGDLQNEKICGDFAETGDVVTFKLGYQLDAGLKIQPQGEAIEILFDGGGHGTHVAGIIGAYYNEGDPLNGLAPGVQILAIKLGNHLYNSATTDLAMIKAVDYAVSKGAHIINCSFGGPSFENNGQEISSRFINTLLEQKRFLMCISAGNEGPALGTVGSPATAENAFAVGACIFPKTQDSNYSVVDKTAPILFPFSSRGPMLNGDIGVDFIAPGAAYSPLPGWHQIKHENWNGTSMASPQLAGALAVLLSGLEEEKISWNRTQIRNALERTATPLPDLAFLEQGSGLPQIPKAFELLKKEKDLPRPLAYRLSYHQDGEAHRGAIFKDIQGIEPFFFNFYATPILAEEQKTLFSRQITLKTDTEWLQVPETSMVSPNGANIRVKVLPHLLQPGVNFGRILAKRLDGPAVGEEFWFPVTVFQPSETSLKSEYSINCKSGERHAFIWKVPDWATHLRIEAKDFLYQNTYNFSIRTLSKWSGGGQQNARFWKNLNQAMTENFQASVIPGELVEFAFQAQFANNRNGLLSLKPKFIGIQTDRSHLLLPAEQNGTLLKIRATGEDINGSLQGKITQEISDISITWTVKKDPNHADLLTQQTLFMQQGEGSFRLQKNEKTKLRFLFDPVLFDFFDDAYFILRDPHQRIVLRTHVTREQVDFEAPRSGDYTLTICVVTLGRKMLLSQGLLHVERAKLVDQKIRFFRTPQNACEQEQESPRLMMKKNERSVRYLLLPELDRRHRYRGSIEFQADHFGKLLDIPITLFEKNLPLSAEEALAGQQKAYELEWKIALEQDPPKALELLKKMEKLGVWSEKQQLQKNILTTLHRSLKMENVALETLLDQLQKVIDTEKTHLENPSAVQQFATYIGWKIRLLERLSRNEEAEKLLEEYRHLDFDNPHFLYFEYERALQKQDWFRALNRLTEIEKREGEQWESRLELYKNLEWKAMIQRVFPQYLIHYPTKLESYLKLLQAYAPYFKGIASLQEAKQNLKKIADSLIQQQKKEARK